MMSIEEAKLSMEDAAEAMRYRNKVSQVTEKKRVFLQARKMLRPSRTYGKMPNWVFAMELYGMGRTYSYRLCSDMGLDPDGCD